jgi:hypothetical protein
MTAPAPSTPCPKCKRPLAAGVKRCIYCGYTRILAAPGTPEYEAEKAAAEADAKKLERQKVIYQHGMGLGKTSAKPGFAERLREQTLLVRVLVMLPLFPLLLMTVPFKAFKVVKEVFRP